MTQATKLTIKSSPSRKRCAILSTRSLSMAIGIQPGLALTENMIHHVNEHFCSRPLALKSNLLHDRVSDQVLWRRKGMGQSEVRLANC